MTKLVHLLVCNTERQKVCRQPPKRRLIFIRFSPQAATLHILLASSKRDNIEKAEIPFEVSRASVKTSLRIMGAEERTRRGAERTGALLCNSLGKVRVVSECFSVLRRSFWYCNLEMMTLYILHK